MTNPELPSGYSFFVSDGYIFSFTIFGKPVYSEYSSRDKPLLYILHKNKWGRREVFSEHKMRGANGKRVLSFRDLTEDVLVRTMRKAAQDLAEEIEHNKKVSRFTGHYPPKEVSIESGK